MFFLNKLFITGAVVATKERLNETLHEVRHEVKEAKEEIEHLKVRLSFPVTLDYRISSV